MSRRSVPLPRIAAILCGIAGAPCGCGGLETRAREAASRVEAPHAVLAPGGRILVVWAAVGEDGRADVLFSALEGDGLARAPVRVNPAPGTAVGGRQVGPRVAAAPGGRVLVAWVDRGRDPAGDILVAVSDDGGRSFRAPTRANADAGFAGQEYQDIAVLPDGSVALAWLDERDAGPDDRNRQVRFALSRDGGTTFGLDEPLTVSPGGVCPCCRPGLAAAADGSLHVAYRDREGADLFVRVASRGPGGAAFGPPVTVSRRGWSFPACPVDGPAVGAGQDGLVRVAWMDGSHGREALWHAASTDGGRSFSRAAPLDSGPVGAAPGFAVLYGGGGGCAGGAGAAPDDRQGRAALAWGSGTGFVAAWEDSSGAVWVKGLDRAGSAPVRIAGGGEAAAGSPQVVVRERDLVVFWTEEDWSAGAGAITMRPRSRLRHARLTLEDVLLAAGR
ncbi:MAG: hypothetical protein HY721_02780 [Planctomycetes bacterium]|nr:hypothetical protein [Planctomycetota bacterium]